MMKKISFMLYLEQFYGIPKNSRTSMYAKIFWFPRNYSIYHPKTNLYIEKRKLFGARVLTYFYVRSASALRVLPLSVSLNTIFMVDLSISLKLFFRQVSDKIFWFLGNYFIYQPKISLRIKKGKPSLSLFFNTILEALIINRLQGMSV